MILLSFSFEDSESCCRSEGAARSLLQARVSSKAEKHITLAVSKKENRLTLNGYFPFADRRFFCISSLYLS